MGGALTAAEVVAPPGPEVPPREAVRMGGALGVRGARCESGWRIVCAVAITDRREIPKLFGPDLNVCGGGLSLWEDFF